MPTALIADDEPLLRDELRDSLAELWPELEIIFEAADGLTALQQIKTLAPDVAFLDIKMPRMTGLEAAEQVDTDTLLVFVTAFDDHAIEAFDHGAVDYVMKPVRVARLAKTIERLKAQLNAQLAKNAEAKNDGGENSDAELATPSARKVAAELNRKSGQYLKFLQASVGKQVRFIMIEEIIYIQSDHKYTRLVTAQSEAFIRKPITELADALDPELFWRLHRSTLVNIRAIDNVVRDDGDKMNVKLRGRTETLEVSRAHQSQFKGM